MMQKEEPLPLNSNNKFNNTIVLKLPQMTEAQMCRTGTQKAVFSMLYICKQQ